MMKKKWEWKVTNRRSVGVFHKGFRIYDFIFACEGGNKVLILVTLITVQECYAKISQALILIYSKIRKKLNF